MKVTLTEEPLAGSSGLPLEQQRRSRAPVAGLVATLGQRPPAFPGRLRVKRVQGHPGVWEVTFAPDGPRRSSTATRSRPASRM